MLSHLLPTPHPLMESKFAAGISTTSLPFRASSPRPFDRARLPEPDPYARRTNPMSIQSATRGATPPPPLPPPRYIEGLTDGDDHAWRFANASRDGSKGDMYAAVAPGSSLLGGGSFRQTRPPERKVDLSPSGEYPLSTSPKSSGGRIPDLAALLEYNKLKGEQHLGQRNRETSSHAYDKSLLQRIGGPSTPPRSGPLSPAEEAHTNGYQNTFQKLNGQLRPLSVPERRYSSNDVERPPLSASHRPSVSPNITGLRSPLSENGAERNGNGQHRRLPTASSLLADENASRYDSSNGEHSTPGTSEDFPRSSPGMNHLSIDDRRYANAEDYQYPQRTGQKRRAVSPPVDHSVESRSHAYSGPGDWSSRQLGITGSRPAQAARMQAQTGSYSASPSSIPRSVASSYSSYSTSKPSTAATSYSSDAHHSPPKYTESHLSQPQQQQQTPPASQQQSESMPPPSQTNGNRAPPVPHRRTTSSGVQRAPGLWICDCCPKKPKKFETEADLRVHEMEKQYVCQYCPNRFKNKNEAERHQNSLHLRHHSWSCAALTTFEMAFHPTPQSNLPVPQPGQPHPTSYPSNPSTDTCGYCGVVFKNPPNWDERVDHLNNDHKFGECNQSKKFYRADHFRQHLKHSHAGTSGKWTNMLENACMKDEPLPQPINRQ